MGAIDSVKRKKRSFCAFCGQPPVEKNREHVLPQWLLKLTGDPNRSVYLGYDHAKKQPREFAYASLTVPACTTCNKKYGRMEARMKPIVMSALSNSALSRDDFSLLLDWLDKVRLGMWTVYYHLDNNLAGIDPFFAIDQRSGQHDRMVVITRSSDTVQDLTYRGCDLPSFYYTPSCFSLMINQYAFTNVSTPFFLAKDFGLPFAANSEIMPGGQVLYSMQPGSGVLMRPGIARDFPLPCTTIYQPMWKAFRGTPVQALYATDYALSIALHHDVGIGALFLEKASILAPFPADPTTDWIPPIGPNTETSRHLLSKATIVLQDRIDDLAPSRDRLDSDERRQYDEILRTNRDTNARLLSELSERWLAHILQSAFGR
jgi:hypothetical protein